MGKSIDLEFLRTAFGDNRVHITLAKVVKLEVVPTAAIARVQVTTMPEELEVVCTVSLKAGLYDLPQPNEIGVIAYSDMEEAHWMGNLSSKDEPIPQHAIDGDTVVQARAGKNACLFSDTKVFIGKPKAKGATDAAEPLVLGTVMKAALTDILADVKTFADAVKTLSADLKTFVDTIKTGPLAIDSKGGSAVTDPGIIAAAVAFELKIDTFATAATTYKTNIDSRKSTYIDTDSSNIVSQVGFTERGA